MFMDEFVFNNANAISYFLYGIIAILVIWFTSKTIKEILRQKEIENYCKSQNIAFSKSITNIPIAVKSFNILKFGGKNFYETAMTGNKDNIKYYLFDHRCIISYGSRSSQTYYSCVCIFSYNKDIFPKFYLFSKFKNEGFLFGLLKIESPHGITFADDIGFSEKIVLQSKQEDEVKEYFNQNIRDCFLRNHMDDCCYEGYKNYFAVSKYGCLKLEERLAFFNKSLKIFQELIQESSNS